MYRSLIAELLLINPALKGVGLPATAFRMGKGMLTEGSDALFTDIAVDCTGLSAFNWFIEQGYLSPLVCRKTSAQLDTVGLKSSGGDFNKKALQEACTKEGVTEEALGEAVDLGWQRRHWLVFCSGIEHAELAAEILNQRGVKTCCVHSQMPESERDARLLEFKRGEWQAITNNGILTTGFDAPLIDLIVMLRPTKSTGLWIQMLGRGTRPVYAQGPDLTTREGRHQAIGLGPKANCLVLDYAGNTERLGPINDPIIPKRAGKGGGTAPVRLCPECECYSHASARECSACGFVFPVAVNLNARASGGDVLASAKEDIVTNIPVSRVVYSAHLKPGEPPSRLVTYHCGLTRFRDWHCFEHGGYPRSQAKNWWRSAAGTPPPTTVEEALARVDELKTPTGIRVWIKTKHSEVLGVEYGPA